MKIRAFWHENKKENKKMSIFGFIRTGGDLLLLYSTDYATELAELFAFEEHA